MFRYDVDIHFKSTGWDMYEVNANCVDNARFTAVKRVIDECGRETAEEIDLVRVYKHRTPELLKEYEI